MKKRKLKFFEKKLNEEKERLLTKLSYDREKYGDLQKNEVGELEEQLMRLWDRQGVRPPAEVWLTFQKSRWLYVPFG